MTDLAAEQRAFWAAIKAAKQRFGQGAQSLWDAGDHAKQIRLEIPHGQWGDHCRNVLGYSSRWVLDVIKFRDNYTRERAAFIVSVDREVKQLSEGSNRKSTSDLTPEAETGAENPVVVDVVDADVQVRPKVKPPTRLTSQDKAILEIDALKTERDELARQMQEKDHSIKELEGQNRFLQDQNREVSGEVGLAARLQEYTNMQTKLKDTEALVFRQAEELAELKEESGNLRRANRKLMKAGD